LQSLGKRSGGAAGCFVAERWSVAYWRHSSFATGKTIIVHDRDGDENPVATFV
jgi:hypothetical protein